MLYRQRIRPKHITKEQWKAMPEGEKDKYLVSPKWYLQYYRNGKVFRECSGTDNERKAEKILQRRLAEISMGEFVSPSDRRITVEDLYKSLLNEYEMNDRASLEGAKQRWEKRLKSVFGHLRACQLSTELLNTYILDRQKEKLSNGTINRDLAALKRAFNIAWRSTPRRVQQVPIFPHLKEGPPRKGFVEQTQYAELCKGASELWLRALLAVAYSFGFRKGELLEMRVNQVDLLGKTIRLWRGTTKSGEPRLVSMTPEVALLLKECAHDKKPDDYVFTRDNGKPILDFRERWDKLCSEAKVELLFHDLRRSAVRNMIRRGIPERVAMEISGHKTRSVFDRYNIVSQADLEDAARRIQQGAEEQKPKPEPEPDFRHKTDINQQPEQQKAALRLVV